MSSGSNPMQKEELAAVYKTVGLYRQIYDAKSAGADATDLYQDLLNACAQAVAIYPQNATLNSNYGWALNECGRLTEAREYLAAAAALSAEDAHILASFGHVLNRLGEHDAARDVLQTAAGLTTDGRYLGVYGYTLILCGETEKAVTVLKEALALAPDKTTFNNLRYLQGQDTTPPYDSYFYVHAGAWRNAPQLTVDDYESILPYMQDKCRQEPQNMDALLRLGETLNKIGRYDAALDPLQTARALCDDDDAFAIELQQGYALIGLKRPAEALPLLQAAADNGYTMPEVFHAIGQAEHATGQPQKALQSFQAAIETDPAFAPAYLGLAKMHAALGQRTQAAEACRQMIAVSEQSNDDKNVAVARAYLHTLAMGTLLAKKSPDIKPG